MATFKKPENRIVTLNLTAMMDVTFQLIIFFILVSNFTAAELPAVDLPMPTDLMAMDDNGEAVVVISIIPFDVSDRVVGHDEYDGRASHVVINGRQIDVRAYDELTSLLKAGVEAGEYRAVDLRADDRLYFDEVEPIMRAIGRAGIRCVNIVTRMENMAPSH